MSIAATLAAGATLGAIGPFAGHFDNPVCHSISIIFSGGWSWACLAFLVGYSRRSKIESALLASSTLAIGVIVYYLSKFLNPEVPVGHVISGGSVEHLGSRIMVWGIAALIFGASVGLVGNTARTPGVGGLLFRLLVPLIAFFETTQRLNIEADSQGPIVAVTWNAIRVAACVVAVALMGHTVWSWHARRSQPKGRAETDASANHL